MRILAKSKILVVIVHVMNTCLHNSPVWKVFLSLSKLSSSTEFLKSELESLVFTSIQRSLTLPVCKTDLSRGGINMDWWKILLFSEAVLNPFVPNAPFLYPVKTSENLTVSWCFQGVEKECVGNEWVNIRNRCLLNVLLTFGGKVRQIGFNQWTVTYA